MRTLFIAVSVCIASLALGQADKGQKTERKTTSDQRGTQSAPLVVEVAPTSKLNIKAETDQEQERQKARNESIVTWSTFALALFTLILACFTGGLMVYTYRLWRHTTDLMKKTDATTKRHERAYIVCGGLFGVLKLPQRPAINDARHYGPPWRMQIQNFGRTPGFVKKVEWGVCPKAQFDFDSLVSKILKSGKLKHWMKPIVEIQEVFPPTSVSEPFPYRHVSPDRVPGEVMFGRITYEDVFGDEHFSTFALLHDESHTTPIGKCYSDDWS